MDEKNKKDIQGEIKDMEIEVHLKQENSKNIRHKNRSITGGIMIIVIGVIFLLNNFIPTLNWGNLWPLILIVVGINIIISHYKKKY